MQKIIYIEGFIYTALPWLTVAGNCDDPWSFKAQAEALTAGLIGLKAFLSTTYSDKKDLPISQPKLDAVADVKSSDGVALATPPTSTKQETEKHA